MDSVQIIMSIYNPNLEYLKKQLISLNDQDYPNLELLIYDDCVDYPCNPSIFSKYLTKIPYRIIPSKTINLNYIKAFEELTRHTTAKYVAFCDQDDIWFPHKISKSIDVLKEDKSLVVASEKQIIDENDVVIKERSREGSTKNYDNWHSFDDIMKYTSIICYAVGMSMVMDGNFLRSIVPFPDCTGHDKWALICASAQGTVSFIEEPLVQYRRHGKNVSGVLVDIDSKEDYYYQRVKPCIQLIDIIKKKYPYHKDISELEKFSQARKSHNIKDLYKYRHLAPDVAKFDIVMALIPNCLFKYFVKIVRKL